MIRVYNKQGIFYPVKSPTYQDLEKIAQKIAGRVSRYLEKAGYLIRDTESEYLDLYTDEEDAMLSIVGASSETALVRHPGRSYRLAFGPNAGK